MHEGPIDTHHEPGTEIWVLDSNTQRRISKIELSTPANSILVTQEDDPKLLIVDSEGASHVYDAFTLSYERSIQIPGSTAFEDL
jgi:methylamine dehydrogenase heavy chain